jgi:hypothetical protein
MRSASAFSSASFSASSSSVFFLCFFAITFSTVQIAHAGLSSRPITWRSFSTGLQAVSAAFNVRGFCPGQSQRTISGGCRVNEAARKVGWNPESLSTMKDSGGEDGVVCVIRCWNASGCPYVPQGLMFFELCQDKTGAVPAVGLQQVKKYVNAPSGGSVVLSDSSSCPQGYQANGGGATINEHNTVGSQRGLFLTATTGAAIDQVASSDTWTTYFSCADSSNCTGANFTLFTLCLPVSGNSSNDGQDDFPPLVNYVASRSGTWQNSWSTSEKRLEMTCPGSTTLVGGGCIGHEPSGVIAWGSYPINYTTWACDFDCMWNKDCDAAGTYCCFLLIATVALTAIQPTRSKPRQFAPEV